MDFTHFHAPHTHGSHSLDRGSDAFVDPNNPLQDGLSTKSSTNQMFATQEDYMSGMDRPIGNEEENNSIFSQSQGDKLIGSGSANSEFNGGKDILVGDSGKGDVDALTGLSNNKESGEEISSLSAPQKRHVLVSAASSDETSSDKTSSDDSTYYVSVNGSDKNPGTKDKPWKTISHAVDEDSPVKAGDTVLVQPGTYTELITLGKSGDDKSGDITLKADGDVTLKDPDPTKGGFREGVIQSAGKSHWTIDGFNIKNTSWAGISLRDAEHMTVQNNHTYETGASGIIVLPDTYYDGGDKEVVNKDIKVLNNTIERANWRWTGSGDPNGTQEALSIWGVDGFEVAGNTVDQGNREGIDAKVGSRNGSIHDNKVTKTGLVSGTPRGYRGGSAIYIDGNRADSYNIDIYNNEVYGNIADAISVADEIPDQGDVSDIRVFNNVVYDNGQKGENGGNGILVSNNVNNVDVFNNTLDGNVQAINVNGKSFAGGYKPHDISVRNNIFANSTYRNGNIQDAKNVTLENNLFTSEFEELYQNGKSTENLKSSDNTKVKSIGFTNPSDNDFHLTSKSAAIDYGSKIDSDIKYDKDGEKRNQGKKIDAGAYELK